MKLLSATLFAAIASLATAMPQTVVKPCPACKGAKSLSITPPNLGQFDGEVGVTPNKPFRSHRFDVKHARCPLCDGTGIFRMYRTSVKPPKDTEGREPCTVCWWSGVEPCQKCEKTGTVRCRNCQTSRFGAKNGWIAEKKNTPGRTSKHTKLIVSPCPDCGGVGKVRCSACEGCGGKPCKRCKAEGSFPAKVKP